MKITTCSILEMLAHHGHIFGDYITAPTIYRLIANSNKELQMAGLQALGAFQHRSIPPSVLATIRQLVLPMLKDGFRNGFIATLALCSCIHEPDFFHGIIRHMGVSDLVDIFVEFLDGHSTGGKISGVRGLMGVMEHGESPQQAISQNSRAAAALVELLGHDKPVVSQAGLHGVLAFGQNDILRPLMRETDVIYSLSRLAVGSDTPDVQRNVLLAFKALVRDDEIAKKAVIHDNYYLGYPPLPRKIKHQLESDPRFKSKVDEDTVQSSTGASTI
ncbi:hypothetical protein BD779DRAFT_623496 [Infundibulicybe gibba]|nr:hypothetical protein BD779DRAFT_623496 [Infundibulicybe gibba]